MSKSMTAEQLAVLADDIADMAQDFIAACDVNSLRNMATNLAGMIRLHVPVAKEPPLLMKLFCWRHKNYGEEAFVIAEDENAARCALLATRIPLPTEPKPSREEMSQKHDLWRQWFDAENQNEKVRCILSGEDHILEVLEANQIAWAEVS